MGRVITGMILMMAVTYAPRVLPLAAMKGRLKSRFIRSFLHYVPYAVLGAMIFPSILYSTGNYFSAVAGMIVALILAYLDKGLMKVAIAAILTVYLCEILAGQDFVKDLLIKF